MYPKLQPIVAPYNYSNIWGIRDYNIEWFEVVLKATQYG